MMPLVSLKGCFKLKRSVKMDLFGNRIDDHTAEKIRIFLNTPQGRAFKEKMSKMNESDLKALLEKAKDKNLDVGKLNEFLKGDISKALNNIDINKLK
jgi:hypothetical protein